MSPLRVVITIDTEVWPRSPGWPKRPLSNAAEFTRDYERCVLGLTSSVEYGLEYLLRSLNQHRLHGVFFIESLFASVVGAALLKDAVQRVLQARQEVQLHVHTEWARQPGLADRFPNPGFHLSDFTLDEQAALIRQGLENLADAGAMDVIALRAGSMGGDLVTLRAAHSAGLKLDMSLDPSRGRATQEMLKALAESAPDDISCPTIPLSCLNDYAGHLRPAQLTAISFRELRAALWRAYRESSPQFVILLHSFELVRPSESGTGVGPHWINIKRWNKLCAFLDENRQSFVTTSCRDLVESLRPQGGLTIFRTSRLHTGLRFAEQLASRFV